MMDEDVVKGIEIWLSARKLEAVHLENKAVFHAVGLFQRDMIQAKRTDEYPWEVIMRGFNDSAERVVKISDVKET